MSVATESVTPSPPLDTHVSHRLRALLGAAAAQRPGVLHVCSSVPMPDGQLRALRIAPGAPPSATDFFMLSAARAQADAIVTTGSVLRHEPELTHALGSAAERPALWAYRRDWLGEDRAPTSVVLSGSGDLPSEHPLWRGPGPVWVFTRPDRMGALRARLPPTVQLHPVDAGGLMEVLDALRRQGRRHVSLEVGPRGVAALYESGAIDELWCSRFEGPRPSARFLAGAWPFHEATLQAWRAGEESVVQEPSGPWRFGRYLPTAPGR